MFWAESELGNPVPMDYTPAENGNVIPVPDGRGGVVRTSRGRPVVRVLTTAQAMAYHGPRYTTHMATCTRARRGYQPRHRYAPTTPRT